jgi:transcription-repair coupling factor (superfamily II helicase)
MKNLRDIILPVMSNIKAGQKTIEVSELWGASKALFLFALKQEAAGPVIVVTSSEDAAEALIEDLRFFRAQRNLFAAEGAEAPEKKAAFEVSLFPSWDLLPFEADSPDSRTVGERMRFLYSLISGAPGVFVVPVQSLMQKLPPWELFADSVKTITKATSIDPDALIAALIASGYESASLVTRVGEFSRRGGIIDFFSPLHRRPVRVELFGDTIESMREFDAETQRSIGEIEEAVVLPVREIIVSDKGKERFERRVQGSADEREGTEQTSDVLTQIQEGMLPPGGEFLASFFYDMETLFQYVPENSLFALIEADDVHKEIGEYVK